MRPIVALLIVTALACSGAESTDEMVDRWAADNDVSAVAVAVISPEGEIDFASASDGGEAPTMSSLFEVGSITKTLVAATALVLSEEGLLELDAPIERWVPSFPRSDEITLRQLLSHTAGIIDGGDRDADLGDLAAFLEPATRDELLAVAAEAVGTASLPAEHRYANSGYWVAGFVIEEATGQSLAAVIRDRILEPLGMSDTYLAWSEPVPAPLVPGEIAAVTGSPLVLGTEVVEGIVTTAWAAGGVVSTAPDVATFYRALSTGLLGPESTAALLTEMGGSEYGLGIERRRWHGAAAGWGHNGAIPGYTASAAIGDNGWTVAVLTNRFQVTAQGLEPEPEALVGDLLVAAGGASETQEQ